MSAYAEAKGFAATAERLRKYLAECGATLTEEERVKIGHDIAWYEDESWFAHQANLQEAHQDADDEKRERYGSYSDLAEYGEGGNDDE